MRRLRIQFVGRVQGVGFRATAHGIARRHPVSGWVRNEPDGTVLMEVQGEPGAFETYLSDLRQRLQGLIEHEHIATITLEEKEEGFEIRR